MYNIEDMSNDEKIKWLIFKVKEKLPKEYWTVTRILKLIYLIDWIYSLHFDRTFTGQTWKYHYYGPFSRKIYEKIKAELNKPLSEMSKNFSNISNSEVVDTIINKVVDRYGKYNFDDLIEIVYATPPMRRAQKGESLVF